MNSMVMLVQQYDRITHHGAVTQVASINATPLPSQPHYPSIQNVMKVAPWTFNCLATSTLLAASRTPRTSAGDTMLLQHT